MKLRNPPGLSERPGSGHIVGVVRHLPRRTESTQHVLDCLRIIANTVVRDIGDSTPKRRTIAADPFVVRQVLEGRPGIYAFSSHKNCERYIVDSEPTMLNSHWGSRAVHACRCRPRLLRLGNIGKTILSFLSQKARKCKRDSHGS